MWSKPGGLLAWAKWFIVGSLKCVMEKKRTFVSCGAVGGPAPVRQSGTLRRKEPEEVPAAWKAFMF